MSQLLAGGIITLGLLTFGVLIFIVSREKTPSTVVKKSEASKKSKVATPPTPKLEQPALPISAKTNIAKVASTPSPITSKAKTATTSVITQLQPQTSVAEKAPSVVEQEKPISLAQRNMPLPAWWHEQFQSLTVQLQYLREHAKDVEQQIAILSEIARLAAELEAIQSKHVVLSEDKPLQFPHRVSRETMDGAYLTDKRPAVRKYTIKAM